MNINYNEFEKLKNEFIKLSKIQGEAQYYGDYKTGNKSYGVVKLNGRLRDINQPLTLDNLPELPKLLYPLRSTKNITGLSEGEGRNNSLFSHLMLVKEQYEDISIKQQS
jgi:hypothetical protein